MLLNFQHAWHADFCRLLSEYRSSTRSTRCISLFSRVSDEAATQNSPLSEENVFSASKTSDLHSQKGCAMGDIPKFCTVQSPAANSTVPAATTPAAEGHPASTAGEVLDCSRGEGLYKTVLSAFSRVRSPDGKIQCIPLAEAARTFIPVYGSIFGEGVVASRLKKDLDNSTTRVTEAAEALEAENPSLRPISVDALIQEEVKKYGIAHLRKDSKNGVKNLLWMKRAVDFIITLLDNVAVTHPDQTTKQCSTEAYNKILLPYHGFLVSNIVSLAFNLCPSRPEFCAKLGFEEGPLIKDCVEHITEVCRPILDDVTTKLEQNGCNFPDKV